MGKTEVLNYATIARFNMWDNGDGYPVGMQIHVLNKEANSGFIIECSNTQIILKRRVNGVDTEIWRK